MTRDEVVRKEIMEKIRSYVKEHNAKGTPINSLHQIIVELNNGTNSMSSKTMYRYFKQMRLTKIEEGYFDFVINTDANSLWKLCDSTEYNKFVCFYTENSFYASLLAEKLNSSLWKNIAKRKGLWGEIEPPTFRDRIHYPEKVFKAKMDKEIENVKTGRKYFYCIALDKITICLYYFKKGHELSLKRSEILEEAEEIAKKIKINILE